MRLIDADKLQEEHIKDYGKRLLLIDVAPTVTVDNYAMGYQDGVRKVLSERPQGDLISRQDAIDALEEQLDYLQMLNKNENPTAEGKWYGVNWARNTIADLPSAQKKGGEE